MLYKLSSALVVALSGSAFAGSPTWSNTLGSPGFSGSYVSDFAVYDDGNGPSLYAIGQFSAVGVTGTSNIARWDGSQWNSVGGGLINQFANTMQVFQGDLIAGGYFDSAGGVAGTAKLARWDGSEWHSMNAQLDSFLSSVWAFEIYDDGNGPQLYIGGNYLDLGGNLGLNHIAKWDGSTYSSVGGTIGGAVPLIILDLQVADLGDGQKLYASGRFLTIGGVAANNVAVWDGSTWAPLGLGITNIGVAQGICMTAFDDGSGPALYLAGSFNMAGGNPASRIAKWDGSDWSAMGDGFDNTVQELKVFNDGSGDALYAMGNFTHSGSTAVDHIARWNGSAWEALKVGGTDDTIFGAIVYDAGEGNALHVGGGFTTAGALDADRAASLLAASCLAEFNGDSELNFFDVQAFLQAFSDMDPAADFNNDSAFDFFDAQAFLQAFSDGCP